MSKVTVVIPNYNGKKYLIPCLDSLLDQTYHDFDVIVVDNASKDGSMEALSLWMSEKGKRKSSVHADTKHTPDVSVERFLKNTGFAAAVNAGIRKAKGEYVFLLNNDTKVRPDCITRLVSFMDMHPLAFSAGAKMLTMSDPTVLDGCGDYYNALGYAFAAGKGKRSADYRAEKKIFSACAGAAMYRIGAFAETGLFDEAHFAYLEDVDIGYRARLMGYENYIVPSAEVLHAGSAVSGSRYNAFKVSLASRNSIYLIYKNQPGWQIILNLPCIAAGCLIKWIFFVRKGLGGVYAKGIRQGIFMCMKKEAKEKKVLFCKEHAGRYLKIQAQLWINVVRMLLDGFGKKL